MNQKLIGISLFFLLFFLPVLASAGVYQACDIDPETNECLPGTEKAIYYEGLVPCGKEVVVGIQLDADGQPILDAAGHPIGESKENFPCQLCHIFSLADNLVKFILINIVPLVGVAMFAIAGVMLYTAGGSTERVTQARKLFKAVIIGLAFIYGAWLLVSVALSLLGVAEWTGLRSGWYKIHCPIQLPS